ncbi:MAG: class F sortase [Candidatus Saccharibacteria bacterium]|nr:class F sortase [Candidatus Saccharibacteria bacterium]
MGLKIKGWRKITKWAVWSALGVLLLGFFIRVATFEANYYGEKEGSERAVAERANEEEELIEVEPTEDEVRQYTVAPDRPRYLTIEKLGINKARILPMGVNDKGELDTPNNIFDVGWYEASGKPGLGGTMIIDGHNGGPHVLGVFKSLPSLAEGDIITVERGDGVVYNYKVVESTTVALSESDEYMATAARSPERGKESVTLISCTGEWSQQQGTYLSRQFVRAVLADGN